MKLLIIDPHMTVSSPSMKGVVRSLPELNRRRMEIEVWCWTCDENLPVTVRKLPRIGDVRFLGLFVFGWLVFWRAWWLFQVQKKLRPDLIYSVAWYHKDCDICHVHFSPFDWENRQRSLGIHSLRDLVERGLNLLALWHARHALRHTTARQLICVSQEVARDMQAENPLIPVHILPNSYDANRFHPGVRQQYRAETRHRLGYDSTHCVFIFVSAGHYRRKGFFLAVEALRQLMPTHPGIRFLVVGGRPDRLAALQAELGHKHDWITFTGMVTDVERYLAAADALLFPSYSEAFALVEIEAAACGLPLFLTPHHGSEMILEDQVNGRQIPFDAGGIASVLSEFVDGRWKPQGQSLKHAIDSETYAERLADIFTKAAA
jgi:glycosyltransferase involved in cell wall biosynthesis